MRYAYVRQMFDYDVCLNARRFCKADAKVMKLNHLGVLSKNAVMDDGGEFPKSFFIKMLHAPPFFCHH
jgi:hypothetical protein